MHLKKGFSGKEKAHKHKLFGPVGLGTTPGMSWGRTWFVLGTNPLSPRNKLISHSGSPGCPGTTPACPQSRGRRAAEKVYVLKVHMPFSLASFVQ